MGSFIGKDHEVERYVKFLQATLVIPLGKLANVYVNDEFCLKERANPLYELPMNSYIS